MRARDQLVQHRRSAARRLFQMPDFRETARDPDPATPTAERCVTSYPARRRFAPGVLYPPQIPGVEDSIDIHCHAHEGQQDALALAQVASEARMGGLLYKTIGGISGGEYRPGLVVRELQQKLDR